MNMPLPQDMKRRGRRFHAIVAAAALALAGAGLRAQSGSYAPLDYTPQGNVGQALVDMEMARHPELKLITIHVTPKGVSPDADKDRCILCSSIGRIGKHDNQEDIDVYRAGKETTELATRYAKNVSPWSVTQAPKYEVATPLLDNAGDKVGLLVIVFGYRKGDDTSKFDSIAHQIRDDIKERIASKDDLLAPAS
jgi:hypothetical protein